MIGIRNNKGGTMKLKMSAFDWTAWIFVVIGAINWGLTGLFSFDVVQIVFGTSPWLAKLVYALIGTSGIYWLVKLIR